MGRARFAKKVFFRNEEGNKRLIQDPFQHFRLVFPERENLAVFLLLLRKGKGREAAVSFFGHLLEGVRGISDSEMQQQQKVFFSPDASASFLDSDCVCYSFYSGFFF